MTHYLPEARRSWSAMPNRLYDFMKWICLIFIPACGTTYMGLSQFWDLPEVARVVGTLTVIETFLGLILGISNASYKRTTPIPQDDIPEDMGWDGEIVIDQQEGAQGVYLMVDKSFPSRIPNKDKVTFKVVRS